MAHDPVTDANGRVYAIRELDPADMLDLFEAAGDASDNQRWVQFALIVTSVTAIDNVPLPLATTKNDIRANAKLIGNAGIVAVSKAVMGEVAPAGKAEHSVDLAKN